MNVRLKYAALIAILIMLLIKINSDNMQITELLMRESRIDDTENNVETRSLFLCDQKLVSMSRLLKDTAKRVGRLTCESSQNQVSANGGWCSKLSGRNSSQHYFDQHLALKLSEFLAGNFGLSNSFLRENL